MKKDFHAMADRILIDTNILLYAYDRAEPVKQPKALAVLDRLVAWRIGVLTPSEDFNVGAIVEGVRFVNPFAEDFNPEIAFIMLIIIKISTT